MKLWINIFRFLQNHWNKTLALISLLGVVIFNFIPDAENYYKLFIFIGANAVVWTIIEIKALMDMDEKVKRNRFNNMREARKDILDCIRLEIKKSQSNEIKIQIIGGRIRTISDMIRELKDDFLSLRLISRNVEFHIYTLKPDFFSAWNYLDLENDTKLKEKFSIYSDITNRLKDELEEINNILLFKDNNIKIIVKHYRYIPHVYSYLIGNNHLFFGFFTWDKNAKDFIGPENPCYYYKSGREEFNDYYNWLQNQIDFIDSTNQ